MCWFWRPGMVLVGLVSAQAAWASEVVEEELALEELVEYSSLIAVVSPVEPPTSPQELPVEVDGVSHEPYRFVVERYTVERVLHDPAGQTGSGDVLEVAPGDLEELYGEHVEHVVHDALESPVVWVYRGPEAVSGKQIVFLRQGSFQERPVTAFTALGARESTGALRRVRRILRSLAKRDRRP